MNILMVFAIGVSSVFAVLALDALSDSPERS